LQTTRDAAQQESDAAQEAQRAVATVRETAVSSAGGARRDLGNLARLAYTSGPTEWTLIETFLDADSPGDALRRASTSQLVAERQDTRWRDAVAQVKVLDEQLVAAAARVAAAGAADRVAEANYNVAQDQVRAIEAALATGGMTGPDGLQAVERSCGGSDIPQCQASGWGEGNLTRDAVWLLRVVRQQWPQIRAVGGYRPTDPFPDHPSGRAVDVMLPDAGRSKQGVALGDEIATYFMQNADRYGIMYLIWHQRIWMADRDAVAPPATWRSMGERGSWTGNHMDHVHVTLSTGVSGSDIYQIVRAAQ